MINALSRQAGLWCWGSNEDWIEGIESVLERIPGSCVSSSWLDSYTCLIRVDCIEHTLINGACPPYLQMRNRYRSDRGRGDLATRFFNVEVDVRLRMSGGGRTFMIGPKAQLLL